MGCCANPQSGIDGAGSRAVNVEQHAYDESVLPVNVNHTCCADAGLQKSVTTVREPPKVSLQEAEAVAGCEVCANFHAKVRPPPDLQMQHATAPSEPAFVERACEESAFTNKINDTCCVDAEPRQAVVGICQLPHLPLQEAEAAARLGVCAKVLAEVMWSQELQMQHAIALRKPAFVEQYACDESAFVVEVNHECCADAGSQQAVPRTCALPNPLSQEAEVAAGVGVCAHYLAQILESPEPQKQHTTAPHNALGAPHVQTQPADECALPPTWRDHAEHEAKLRKALRTFALEPELLRIQVKAKLLQMKVWLAGHVIDAHWHS